MRNQLLWWYAPDGMVEGDENGPFPWLVGKSDVIELQAVGLPGPGRKGDASEYKFMGRGFDLDFRMAKPCGNVDPYDVLVAIGQRGFWRVQVRRAQHTQNGDYMASTVWRKSVYTKDQIDFLAAHLAEPDIWYIVPIEACGGKTGLHFGPGGRGMYEKYREAWCLLAVEEKNRGRKDVPKQCRCPELPVRCAACPNKK
jgi:hypothetical protein